MEEFDRLMGEGEKARRARRFDKCFKATKRNRALSRRIHAGKLRALGGGAKNLLPRAISATAGVDRQCCTKTGDWSKSLQLAQRILHEDQFREDIHCQIMRGHAAMGNRAAVKEHYEALKRILQEELGVEPARKLTSSIRNLSVESAVNHEENTR